MASVLVFSKDRPMQLHAYLESLIMFSDMEEVNISVLYCHQENISYDKVINSFPNVCWIKETNFYSQVVAWVQQQDEEYVMFGCDDVVFTKNFSMQHAAKFLEQHDNIFGFSLRLGRNLIDFPEDVCVEDKYCYWEWNVNKNGGFYYPWELDCTLYRKEDVINILTVERQGIRNPNYLEEFVAVQPEKYIQRKYLSCYYSESKAIVITVNRVQETHKNPVDDSLSTDAETLSYLYNKEDVHLDIPRIAKKKNRIVHVDSDFFILDKNKFQEKKKNKLLNRMRRLYKNLKYLSKVDLETESIDRIVSDNDVEISAMINKVENPHILTADESISLLEKKPKSFCRIGDGELNIIAGKSIPFQKFDSNLKRYLSDLVSYKCSDLYVGLPYFYYDSTENLNPVIKRFIRSEGNKYRELIYSRCDKEQLYLDTAITQIYQTYVSYDFDDYFERIKNLFREKKIVLVIGKGIMDEYKHNVFEYAAEVKVIEGPKIDAFDEIDVILNKLYTCEKDRLICTVLGPAAKAIVVEMTARGYMVWDIGHLLKDYNYYMEGVPRTKDFVTSFYKPD